MDAAAAVAPVTSGDVGRAAFTACERSEWVRRCTLRCVRVCRLRAVNDKSAVCASYIGTPTEAIPCESVFDGLCGLVIQCLIGCVAL